MHPDLSSIDPEPKSTRLGGATGPTFSRDVVSSELGRCGGRHLRPPRGLTALRLGLRLAAAQPALPRVFRKVGASLPELVNGFGPSKDGEPAASASTAMPIFHGIVAAPTTTSTILPAGRS